MKGRVAEGFLQLCCNTCSLLTPHNCAVPLSHLLQLARGIVAIGSMSATSINKTAAAVAGAIGSYADNLMNQTAPLSQPLTVSSSYVNR